MKLFIRDKNAELIKHLQVEFSDCPGVECSAGNILDLSAIALVSPANSFGFMDGGIDWVYTLAFGPELQYSVQKEIQKLPNAELLVGQAIMVEIPKKVFPISYLIVAPTMRVPELIRPVNVFLAMRAAIQLALSRKLLSVLMPGMGTGSGKVSYEAATKAMRQAYINAYYPKFPPSLAEAKDVHNWLNGEKTNG
jgi:O-acetyl-ADP-ribose deacetylase (regulator of RNase III)